MAVYNGRSAELWVQLLRDNNVKRREEAVHALGRLGAESVAPLVRLFAHGKTVDRHWVLEALAEIGPAARPALPLVRKSVHDPHSVIRRAARRALARIDPASASPTWKRFRRWIARVLHRAPREAERPA